MQHKNSSGEKLLLPPDSTLEQPPNGVQLQTSPNSARPRNAPHARSPLLKVFFSWDLSLPITPQPSRLFHLEPIGIGTPNVESLTGYIARLAEAHSVSPGVLFGHELLPLLDNPYWQNQLSKKEKTAILGYGFLAQTPTINGTGKVASQWVQVLENATLQSGLRRLTLVEWRDFLSTLNLLRRKRAWCSACYQEWSIRKLPLYEPLIWSFEATNICVSHRRRLQSTCHNCNRQSYPLSTKTRPGFCSCCGFWLGRSLSKPLPAEILSDAEAEWETFVATSVGNLLSTPLARFARQPTKETIARSLDSCIKQLFGGNASILSREARIAKQTITNWRRGSITPHLEGLLRVCFHSKLPLISFLSEAISTVARIDEPAPLTVLNVQTNKQRPPRKLDLVETERLLENALTERPPRCLSHVAQSVDRRATTFRHHFPELCKAIVARYAAYEEHCLRNRLSMQRTALQVALVDNTHPSTVDIARRLGVLHQNLIKVFPQLCKEVSRRHIEARNARWSAIGVELNRMLEEWPPPSMREICKRIGYCQTSLDRHHYNLCRRLCERHLKFRYKQLRRTPTDRNRDWKH